MKDPSRKKRKQKDLDESHAQPPSHPRKIRVVETDVPDTLKNEAVPQAINSSTEKAERRPKKRVKINELDVERAQSAAEDHVATATSAEKSKSRGLSRQEKSERRSKKSKKSKPREPSPGNTNGASNLLDASSDDPASPKVEPAHADLTVPTTITNRSEKSRSKKADSAQPSDATTVVHSSKTSAPDSSHRYILFIGNLPYTATTPELSEHFSKLAPQSIRHPTDKSTGRSKGYAFLEFDAYDRMKTCLKLYHHSMFKPSAIPKISGGQEEVGAGARSTKGEAGGRKINVELTAGGGGGKSSKRREKIKVKNKKLGEERERAREMEKEEEQQLEGPGAKPQKAKQRDGKKKTGPATPAAVSSSSTAAAQDVVNDWGDIHPSRRSRVQ